MYELFAADDIVVLGCRHVQQGEINWNLARRNVWRTFTRPGSGAALQRLLFTSGGTRDARTRAADA